MSGAGTFRLLGRTVADIGFGLVLFATLAFAVATYNHDRQHQYSLSGLLAAAPSTGDLMKFSLDDNSLIAAAVVATAIPVPQQAMSSGPRPIPQGLAIGLLAGIVSLIVALNLAFFRHLRRAYVNLGSVAEPVAAVSNTPFPAGDLKTGTPPLTFR
ncbi:hypothetical protein [Hyphomicrobium sulfonivorans]|uniref:hypothetical protein n=1 Tax=Hyphomicrobium sulfonivorans TaxID=121290 RepID=UPI0018E1BF4C|nr:hypothetical protein [Hyphomicrobium sulfonivorans]MBI1651204.1 hypothetical protein [Hyphomicrobium sulfonivorans]NSL73188.1 hypothetical protein [Hyphomicrobium sulfonivorans]